MRHSHPASTVTSSRSRIDGGARGAHATSSLPQSAGTATLERTLAHVFTSPVVREVLPTRTRAVATW